MPSVHESFGVAAIEASSCALPVVASWGGGVGEVVLDEVTGLLVPPNDPEILADALERLLDDARLRAEMGTNGRALVRKAYDWTKNADQMEALYRSVMEVQPRSTYDYLID
ncbi:Alpha-D-kanosaminyltransferase [compost metagenome]